MADIRAELNLIWQMFQRVGIADDLQIIEHLAALLVKQQGLQPSQSDLLPQLPTSSSLNFADVTSRLDALATTVGAATLFDRYILFHLTRTAPGLRYPTPRHIVRFMHAVATVEPQHALADFACGSGGLLALRQLPTDSATTTYGCEIALVWARMAWANCALHGISNPKIEIGNAFDFVDRSEQFDRILINPPFGATVSQRSSQPLAGRSETAFTNLALDHLRENGRACVLHPAGTLFGGGAERELRRRLIEKHRLDAVISFSKEAFQPFSPIPTHIVLTTKTLPDAQSATWFLRAERDGYPSGRGRDLTTDVNEKESDIPLIEAILAADLPTWDTTAPAEQPICGIKRIATRSNEVVVCIGALASAHLGRVERYTAGNVSVVLATVKNGEQTTLFAVNLAGATLEGVDEGGEQFARNKLGLSRNDSLTSVTLHQESNGGNAIAVTESGGLLGTLVPRQRLINNSYDLRPEQYARAEEQRGPLRKPGELLADIRGNQRSLTRRIDGMLGRLESPPIDDTNLLAPLWEEDAPEPLLALLSSEQSKVWAKVEECTRQIDITAEAYDTPTHFNAANLGIADVSNEVVQSTLHLFERMGLIVQVSIQDDTNSTRMIAYRRISQRDRWNIPVLPADEANL